VVLLQGNERIRYERLIHNPIPLLTVPHREDAATKKKKATAALETRLETWKKNEMRNLLGLDTHGVVLNAASIDTLGHTDVAVLTPVAAPRVLDNPVLGAVLNTPADSSDTVVERVGAAARAVHDTAAVGVVLGGINSDGDGTVLLHGGHELLLALGVEGEELSNLHLGLGGVELASALLGSVRIVVLGHHAAVLLDVLEGVSGPATVAAVVVGVAIDNTLLREAEELLVLQEVGSLHGAGGAEGPARAALSLVLDRGDGTLVTPVEGLGSGSRDGDLTAREEGRDVKSGEELADITIRVLGPAIGGKRIDLVELSSTGHVLLEDLIAAGLLRLLVGLAELALEAEPEGIVLEGHGGLRDRAESKERSGELHLDVIQ